MRLIGMLDSPYVRRTAITLDALGVPFEHESVSVFTNFDRFWHINPVVKAPTLVCPDGTVLMDSSLILQYVEMDRFGGHSPLWSANPERRLRQFRTTTLAMAACDKGVQLAYETKLRPPGAQHPPWQQRVRGQLQSALSELESLTAWAESVNEGLIDQATITTAVMWQCLNALLPDEVEASGHPRLAALSEICEALPLFLRYPPQGPGVPGLEPGKRQASA